MSEILLVATTLETQQEAEDLATCILDKRLAACAQITGPITSLYWWQGKIENSKEYILSLKSTSDLYDSLEQLIKENHPYETPEIIATRLNRCSHEYKIWLEKEINEGA